MWGKKHWRNNCFCFYLQLAIQDEEFDEEEVTSSRSLVHIEESSLGCLSLETHCKVVDCAEVDPFKLQI